MAVATASAHDVAALLARLGVHPRGITADSRRVGAGIAFAAYPGTRRDGRAYIGDAVAAGAAAVLWEAEGFAWRAEWRVPAQPVTGLQARLGGIADFIYGSPSRELWVVGVTGTNGKTSCSHWIAQALAACGRTSAVVGTLGNGPVGALAPARNTTPDVCSLHELLRAFRRDHIGAVAMEVSSHGLDQGRVNGVAFDVALFTNLSRDHLDYHGTMVAYGKAKAKLFEWPGLASAVINADDAFGQGLIEAARARGQRVLTYGFGTADVAATGIAQSPEGIEMSVVTPRGAGVVQAPVVGAFNAHNLLGVLGVLLESGVSLDDALAALARLEAPAGRMQRLGGGGAPLVVVDYAHSPDALEKVLTALKPAASGELVCVFGCGGDRDKGKRPEMGRVAAALADRIVVTTDNPRHEAPADIAAAVADGVREAGHAAWRIELDRATAIAAAIAAARPGDVVLVAGKGHEDYQEVGEERHPFSDVDVARAALAARDPA